MTDQAVSSVYAIAVMFVAGLLVYIMQKVEDDRWSKTDPLWLQWTRRAAFVATAIVLLYSVESTNWQFTCLLLVGASSVILFINALALSLRAPPKNRGRVHHHQSFRSFYFMSKVMRYLHSHR